MVGEYYLAPLPDKGGRITAESVAECSWNQWQDHSGISGRMLAEYALLFEAVRLLVRQATNTAAQI